MTGTVIVPTAAWTGKGARPVVTIGIGTQGIGPQCAPSKQMEAGTEYDGTAIIGALKAGYAVDVTDYQGYTNGAIPPTGRQVRGPGGARHRARREAKCPESGLTESNPVVAWGYSQGGQAVGWAGELQPTYAPDVKLSASPPAAPPPTCWPSPNSARSVAAGFALDGLLGLETAYPERIPPNSACSTRSARKASKKAIKPERVRDPDAA